MYDGLIGFFPVFEMGKDINFQLNNHNSAVLVRLVRQILDVC
ncbi:MAG: hypothetical protein BWZ06_01772 [Bacteroidetes bacterium ADurb.BinA261]|jgi:hypothetical protein|nr:MAG: hypothetical protein BWZ06_01772 [Bacteroidetes bacterium ADurb.BinA261]